MAGLYSQTDPAHSIVAVTESDTTADPNGPFRGIIIDDASTSAVKFTMPGGGNVTLTNLAIGVIHWINVTRVWSTGTDATLVYGVK